MKAPNQFRLDLQGCRRIGLDTRLASDEQDGCNGMFMVPINGRIFRCMISDGRHPESAILGPNYKWEHVSVSLPNRCPTWEEMCAIKAVFWDDEECVMQLHPPKSEWVNNHPYCLHLWRPLLLTIPRPPTDTVGIKT